METLEAFYSATMEVLEDQRNEVSLYCSFVSAQETSSICYNRYRSQRLSIKCNLKLAKLWLDRKEYSRLRPVGIAMGSSHRIGRAS
jgi:COP9 signalosome complex subunit 2